MKYTYDFYDDIIDGKKAETKTFEAKNEKEANKMCYEYAVATGTFRTLVKVEEK